MQKVCKILFPYLDPQSFCSLIQTSKAIYNSVNLIDIFNAQRDLCIARNLNPVNLAVKYNQIFLLKRCIDIYLITNPQDFIQIIPYIKTYQMRTLILDVLQRWKIPISLGDIPMQLFIDLYDKEKDNFDLLLSLNYQYHEIPLLHLIVKYLAQNYRYDIVLYIIKEHKEDKFILSNPNFWNLTNYSNAMLEVWKYIRTHSQVDFSNSGILNLMLLQNREKKVKDLLDKIEQLEDSQLFNFYWIIDKLQKWKWIKLLYDKKLLRLLPDMPNSIVAHIINKSYISREYLIKFIFSIDDDHLFIVLLKNGLGNRKMAKNLFIEILPYKISDIVFEAKLFPFTKDEITLMIEKNISIIHKLFQYGIIKL